MSDEFNPDDEEMIENLELLLNLDTLENSDLWEDFLNEKFSGKKAEKQSQNVSQAYE